MSGTALHCTCDEARRYAPPGRDLCCGYCFARALGGDGSEQSTEERKRLLAAHKQADAEALQCTTAQFLALLGQFIGRFVILPSSESYLALSLFVLHTWVFESAHATPYVVVESPEKQSGKTRLLEVLQLVCHSPLKTSSITAAALFQSVDGRHPTLLIDEADAIFAGNSERNEDLRGVLNAGNLPGSPVIRGGKDGTPVSYDVFCPKVIAGIATGKLPDTIRDRAIVIPIDRKLRSEQVERMRRRRLSGELDKLRSELGAWARQSGENLEEYDLPKPMEAISDRLEEAWEPLLAIADLAGGVYPARARAAAEDLAGGGDDTATASHVLLMALQDVFGKQHVMSTRDILVALNGNDDLPFGSWNDGKGLQPRELAKLLSRYRVKPTTIRTGGLTPKGYHRNQFKTAWERYGGVFAATSATSQQPRGFTADSHPQQTPECGVSREAENPNGIRGVADVAAKTAPTGSESEIDALATPEEEALFEQLQGKLGDEAEQ